VGVPSGGGVKNVEVKGKRPVEKVNPMPRILAEKNLGPKEKVCGCVYQAKLVEKKEKPMTVVLV